MTGVLKDYQPPRMMGVEGVAAKWGISAPGALYILWLHHVPIRTQRGGPFPPPERVPLALPASMPQPLIVPGAAPEQQLAAAADPAGEGRTFLVKDVVILTGRRLDAVYQDIHTGKLRTEDRLHGRWQPYQIREADLRDYIREIFENSDELLGKLDVWPDAARTAPFPPSCVAPVPFVAPVAPQPPAVITPEPHTTDAAEPAGTGRFFLAGEIAAMLRVNKQTVYRAIRNGNLRAVNVSKGRRPTFRVYESDLRKWLEGDRGALAFLDAVLAASHERGRLLEGIASQCWQTFHHLQRAALDQACGVSVAPTRSPARMKLPGHLGHRQGRLQRVAHQLHADLEALPGRPDDSVHHQGHRRRAGRVAVLAGVVDPVHGLHQAAIRAALSQSECRSCPPDGTACQASRVAELIGVS